MTGGGTVKRTRRSQPSALSNFLELPRELRDMIYEWVIILTYEERTGGWGAHMLTRRILNLSDAIKGPYQALKRVGGQIETEFLSCAHEKCKVVGGYQCGYHLVEDFDLVWPENSISTSQFRNVKIYEMVYPFSEENGDLIPEASAIRKTVTTAICCLYNLEELNLRFDFHEFDDFRALDPDGTRVNDSIMSFFPRDTKRISRLRKTVAMGFYQNEDTIYEHIFEYRIAFITGTQKLVNLKCHRISLEIPDSAYREFVHGLNVACEPYIAYMSFSIEPPFTFNKIHESIRARYDEWEKLGKPEPKDVPHFKIAEALRDLDTRFPENEIGMVLESLVEYTHNRF